MTQNLLEEVDRAFGSGPVPGSLACRCASGGSLGACGRAGLHIPGRGGERGGRPCEQLAALAPSARSWGRSLARSPAHSQSLAFCAATFPEPFGEAPHAVAPGKFAFPGFTRWGPRQAWRTQPVLGALWQLRPRRKVATRGPAPIVRVSAQWPQRAHVGSGRRQTTLGPWPPDKAVLEGAAKLLSAFLRGTRVGSESTHCVLCWLRSVSVRELAGPKRQSQRLVPLSGPPGDNVCGRRVGGPLGLGRGWGVLIQGLPLCRLRWPLFFYSYWPRRVSWGHLWQPLKCVCMSLKDLHRISSEFETFKFSNSYVSTAECTSGLQRGT